MDDNTLKAIELGLSALTAIVTIVAPIFIYRKQQQTHDLVNGLTHENTASALTAAGKSEGLIERAARAEGMIAGSQLTPIEIPPTEKPHVA